MNTIKSKWIMILAIGVFLAGILLPWLYFLRIDTTLIGSEVTMKRVVFGKEKSTGGRLLMTFNNDSDKYHFVNVVVDLNKDGTFAEYQMNAQTQPEWLVQNMEVPIVKAEGLGLAVQLTDVRIDQQQDIPVKIIFSKEKLNHWRGGKRFGSAMLSSTVKSIELDDVSLLYEPDPEGKRSGGAFSDVISPVSANDTDLPDTPNTTGEESNALSAGPSANAGSQNTPAKEKTVETMAKEFSASNKGMPDLDQKKNECVPTATANSLLWLAAQGDYLSKLPATAPELISELKNDFSWSENGINVQENFLTGKAAVISRHSLPLVTHGVGNTFDVNIVYKIAQEIKKGQDVELDLAYYKTKPDGTQERVGGHMVTVVGARGTRDAQYLDLHDPLTSGTNQTDTYKIVGSRIVDYPGGNIVTYIRYAIAESPAPPPATPPSDASTPSSPDKTTPTTPTTPTATSSPTRTARPAIEIGMTGEYTITKQNDLHVLRIKFKPTRQENVDKKINGVELTLADQVPSLPSNPKTITAYINSGSDSTQWPCKIATRNGADVVQCQSSTTLKLNKENELYICFEEDIQQMNPLYLNFMGDGKVLSTMNPIAK